MEKKSSFKNSFTLKATVTSLLAFLLLGVSTVSHARTPEDVKSKILALAESFKGQGDQDHSKQEQLEPMVQELAAMTPQVSGEERLRLLAGPWKQIFGPYIFDDSRGVDKNLDPDNIYQVISPKGYYYNIARNRFLGGSITAILRGVYELAEESTLKVHFTSVRVILGAKKTEAAYVSLAEAAETGRLKAFRVPGFLTGNLNNQGGSLKEVYTDADLRIAYGSSNDEVLRDYIYVLRKVK